MLSNSKSKSNIKRYAKAPSVGLATSALALDFDVAFAFGQPE